jgi:hypothetical protein
MDDLTPGSILNNTVNLFPVLNAGTDRPAQEPTRSSLHKLLARTPVDELAQLQEHSR